MTKPLVETLITKGTGRHSGDGECGFIALEGTAEQVSTRSDWKKKKTKINITDVLDYTDLFPNSDVEGKFRFTVTVEVEWIEKPRWL